MRRKIRFLAGLLIVASIYSLPLAGLASLGVTWLLAVCLGCFAFSIYMVYRITIKNIKPKYPIVNPEGHPDVYTGVMPRPIYEDMQRYPWFFRKKKPAQTSEEKKLKKKH